MLKILTNFMPSTVLLNHVCEWGMHDNLMKLSYYLSTSLDNVLDDIGHVCVYKIVHTGCLTGWDSVLVAGIGNFAVLTLSRIACSSPYLLSSGYWWSFLWGVDWIKLNTHPHYCWECIEFYLQASYVFSWHVAMHRCNLLCLSHTKLTV